MGVVCGDFSHFGLLPEDGDEFSVFADEEEIEKLFGKKTGKKARARYPVEIGWQSDDIENPDSETGSCAIYSTFRSGKVIEN